MLTHAVCELKRSAASEDAARQEEHISGPAAGAARNLGPTELGANRCGYRVMVIVTRLLPPRRVKPTSLAKAWVHELDRNSGPDSP